MEQTLFISYAWSDSAFADEVDNAFQPTGLYIKRDIRELGYKDSIKSYMGHVRTTDFVLLIISDSFLKSANCMYEVLEFLKERDFSDKILPTIVDGTKIFKPAERLEYVKYWTQQHNELKEKLEGINPTDAIELYQDLKHLENIRVKISEFLAYLADKNIPQFSSLKESGFRKVFDYIGVSGNELTDRILSIRSFSTIDEREIALDKIEDEFPNNAKVFFTKASYAYEEGRIDKSIHFYKKSIEIDPDFGPALFNQAFNKETKKDFDEAKTLYIKSIKIDPSNTRAYNNLAGLLTTHYKEYTTAQEYYKDLLLIDPFNAAGHYNYACLLQRELDNPTESRVHYEAAIDINPDFADAKHNYGMLLQESFSDNDNAKQQFLGVLVLEPNKKNTLKQLGKLFEFNYKDLNSAKEYYNRFLAVEPNDADDYYFYATFLMLHFLPQYKKEARFHYDLACKMDDSLASKQAEVLLR